MSKWSQKKQLMGIAISAAFVCSVAAGGVFYVNGLIADVDAQHEVKQGELRVADAKISKIPVLEKEVVILRENLGEYVKILPDDDQLNDFVRMVNRFAMVALFFLHCPNQSTQSIPITFNIFEFSDCAV